MRKVKGVRLPRRTFLAALGGLTVLVRRAPGADTAPAAGPADAWPQFRRDARLTGVASGALPPTLRELWSFEAGDAIDSSAAIADGMVYVGSHAGHLVGLDLATGAAKFKYAAGAEIGESSPAVANGIVYVGDLSGTVHAVGAADGQKKWTF